MTLPVSPPQLLTGGWVRHVRALRRCCRFMMEVALSITAVVLVHFIEACHSLHSRSCFPKDSCAKVKFGKADAR